MADINQIITLGIGTPSDIGHFVLVGLTPNTIVPPTPSFKIIPIHAGLGQTVLHAERLSVTVRAEQAIPVLMAGLSAAEIHAGVTTLQLQAEREAQTILAESRTISLQADAGED